MSERLIKPAKGFYRSDLFSDFIEKKPAISEYLLNDSLQKVVDKLGAPKVDQHFLCDILVKQNESFYAKSETFRSIEKLRQDGTLAIFAGQQPGLFGGPLLTLYKAIDVVKKAVLLQGEIGRPVVPVFWISCGNYDFDEVNQAYYPTYDGKIEKIVYSQTSEDAVPLGDICFDRETDYDNLVDLTRKAFGHTDFSDELYDRLFTTYSTGNSFIKSFAQYLTDILPDIGLIIFCPHDNDIKTISKSFFKRIAEGHFKMKELLRKTSDSLKKDNYRIQVEEKESAVHLSYYNPERTTIHFREESFIVGEKKLGLPAIIDLIDKYPEKFSPDVLTRPIWQSYLFPVVAQTCGSSEIANFCQTGKLFEMFNLVQPYIVSRSAMTLIEKPQEQLLEKHDIDIADLAGDVEQVIDKAFVDSFPEEVEYKFDSFKKDFKIEYDELVDFVLDSYRNLKPTADKTFDKIDHALNNFKKEIHSLHKKENDAIHYQIRNLASAVFPNNNLQEESINLNYFISKYGFGIVDYIIENIDINSIDHQLIYLSKCDS